MTTSQNIKREDDVFNYNCSLLTDCFLFFNFLDAIKEVMGCQLRDSSNISCCTAIKLMAPVVQNMHWNVCSSFFLIMYALLSPRDCERNFWDCFVNNYGKRGSNIPLDEDTEHSNNFIKQGIRIFLTCGRFNSTSFFLKHGSNVPSPKLAGSLSVSYRFGPAASTLWV